MPTTLAQVLVRPVASAAALAALALTAACGAGDAAGDAPQPASSPTPTSVVSAKVWCNAYADFADAYGFASSASGGDLGLEQLQQAGDALVSVGQPRSMDDEASAGLGIFIDDALTAVGADPVTYDDENLVNQQRAAFSTWLTTACPGY